MALRFLNSGYFAGKVGIGTESPGVKFVVQDDGTDQIIADFRDSNSVYGLLLSSTTTGGKIAARGTNHDLTINTSGTGDITLIPGGNVGIGTTSPDALLEISGNAGADPGPITNPTTFRITDSGNAATGLGDTTNPWGKIEFYSEDASASGPSVQTQISSIYDNIYSYASSLTFSTRVQPSTTLLERMRIKPTGAIQFNAYDSTNNTGTPTYLLGTDASGNVVKTLSSSAPGSLWAASGNNIYNTNSANVGIGDTTPSFPLVISKSSSVNSNGNDTSMRLALSNPDQTNNNWALITFGDGTTQPGSGFMGMQFTDHTNNYGELSFGTRGVGGYGEKMRVTSAGKVGIGTPTPAVKLQVYGEAMPETTDAASVEEMLTLYRNGSATVWSGGATLALGRYSTAGASSPKSRLDFKLKAAAGSNTDLPETTVMTMQADTKVGIGTITPTARLDITNGEGKFCVDSKTHALTNAFTTCLTVNLNSHTGCYVTITCFGDWGSHSAAAYRGEFFLQNGANGYSEPGIILRQDDNTSNGTDQIVCQILDPTSTANPKNFEIQIRTTATTGTTSFTGQLTYTVQGKFNSIT